MPCLGPPKATRWDGDYVLALMQAKILHPD